MVNDSSQPQVSHFYGPLRFFTRQVVNGDSNLLVLNAPAGIGKSYQINKEIKSHSSVNNYVKKEGYLSPLELFHTLQETSQDGDILFLDDVSGITDDDRAINLLKAATWSEDEDRGRVVSWNSTSDKVQGEQEFTYQGRIIMCFNEIPNSPHMKAIISRSKYYEMGFTYEERIDIIQEIAKLPYKSTSYEERDTVATWIEHFTDETYQDLNLRILFHCLDIYESCKSDNVYDVDDWTLMATELMQMDEELQLVKNLLEKPVTIEEASTLFEERTGLGRRTFYRRKKKLEEKVGRKL